MEHERNILYALEEEFSAFCFLFREHDATGEDCKKTSTANAQQASNSHKQDSRCLKKGTLPPPPNPGGGGTPKKIG